MTIDRRELLAAGSAALGVGLAGCAAEEADDPDEADEGDTGADDPEDEADEEETDDAGADGEESEDADGEEIDDTDGTDDGEREDDEATDAEEDVEEPPMSVITLTVLGPAGEPVEGAEIYGMGESHETDIPLEFTGVTDDEGVHAAEIYENEYTIEVSHGNFETATVEHDHDGETEPTVELDSAEGEPGTSLLSLRVTDAVGNPIEGAEVLGVGDSHPSDIPLEFSGETDDDGFYDDEIYENEYTIEIDHDDYVEETIEHSHDGEHEVVVELDSEDEEPDTSELSLRVTDDDGDPVGGAEILGEADDAPADVPLEFSGETDDEGIYDDVIYENEYTIEVTHDDHRRTLLQHDHMVESSVGIELRRSDDDGPLLLVDAIHPVTGDRVDDAVIDVSETGAGGEGHVVEAADGTAAFGFDPGEYSV